MIIWKISYNGKAQFKPTKVLAREVVQTLKKERGIIPQIERLECGEAGQYPNTGLVVELLNSQFEQMEVQL